MDLTKLTLCPALDYKYHCQVCGKCEYCQFYFKNQTNDGVFDYDADCYGCGANFENQENINAKFE